jgi:tRNA pseudouridine38-40 synthase
MDACEVDLEFDSRKSAKRKTYLYQIHNNRIISALEEDFYFSPRYKLDIDKMKDASKFFIGEHDFIAFAAAKNSSKTTVRTIYDIEWKENGEKIFFEITGSGFLMKMVRNIMGTLIEIGNNKRDVNSINDILKSKNRDLAGATAPANGLFLKEVFYA